MGFHHQQASVGAIVHADAVTAKSENSERLGVFAGPSAMPADLRSSCQVRRHDIDKTVARIEQQDTAILELMDSGDPRKPLG